MRASSLNSCKMLMIPSPGPERAGSSAPLAQGHPFRGDNTKHLPNPVFRETSVGYVEGLRALLSLQEMSILSRQDILGASLGTGAGQQENEPLDWLLPSDLRAVGPTKSRWCCCTVGAPCTALASCTPLTLCLTDYMQIPGTSSFYLMQSQPTSCRKNQVLNCPRSGCPPGLQPPSHPRQPFLQIQH